MTEPSILRDACVLVPLFLTFFYLGYRYGLRVGGRRGVESVIAASHRMAKLITDRK